MNAQAWFLIIISRCIVRRQQQNNSYQINGKRGLSMSPRAQWKFVILENYIFRLFTEIKLFLNSHPPVCFGLLEIGDGKVFNFTCHSKVLMLCAECQMCLKALRVRISKSNWFSGFVHACDILVWMNVN